MEYICVFTLEQTEVLVYRPVAYILVIFCYKVGLLMKEQYNTSGELQHSQVVVLGYVEKERQKNISVMRFL